MQSLLSPGDEVISISPAYQSLYEVARSMGCKVVPWKLQAREGQWALNLDALREAITPRTRLLVINFPHNPTGFLPGRQQFFEILEIARQHELAVFSDEMYRLLEHDPAERLPAVCDVYERGVSLAGMSKTFALPGLRIGWLATQDAEWMDRWKLYKDYTTICSSAPSEILALMGLRAKDELLKRSLGIIRSNLAHARQFFAQHPDLFCWYPPRAGSTAFPEYLGAGSVDEFCQRLVEASGVMLVPASMFDAPGNHFRLGLGRKNCAEALQQVSAYLANLLQ
jgi:aspartate/methionine/tyrosine aminotransferase